MKDSKKYQALLLAVLVSFTLAGCSSVTSTQEPTASSVRDSVVQITNSRDSAEKPAPAQPARSALYPSVRSGRVWMSREVVKDLPVQKVQGHALLASDTQGAESVHQSLWDRLGTKSERPTAASESPGTPSVSDALEETLGGGNIAGQPTVSNAVGEVIAATEIADDGSTDEESSNK
ncbi:MAG: hypothetical protein P8Z79_02725 [Sedimentisphaerales bacterium]|jgi:uncharacterized protein YceK